eukprot:scaffold310_cov302-Prasinococcus_capsulatus_cf.AAC.1
MVRLGAGPGRQRGTRSRTLIVVPLEAARDAARRDAPRAVATRGARRGEACQRRPVPLRRGTARRGAARRAAAAAHASNNARRARPPRTPQRVARARAGWCERTCAGSWLATTPPCGTKARGVNNQDAAWLRLENDNDSER